MSRKTSKGIPRYGDSDVFILSGAEDLVPAGTAGEGVVRYRPRTEGLFAHIDHHRAGDDDYWEVASRDGLISLYGTPGARSTSTTGFNDEATLVDPTRPEHVYAWKLTRTTDPFGNTIHYHYVRDEVNQAGPHHWDQLYLSEIRYGDYGDPGEPGFLVQVKFIYEDVPRPDPFSDYRAGFEIRTTKRCVRIDLHSAGSETPSRSYEFEYLDQRNDVPEDRLPLNRLSLLSRVRVVGVDGPSRQALPVLEFGYSAFEPRRRRYQACTAPANALPDRSLGHGDYELVDLFGNGLSDILQLGEVARYWRNRGDGRFDGPRPLESARPACGWASRGCRSRT